jgi:predicted nucleic acid-binding protein
MGRLTVPITSIYCDTNVFIHGTEGADNSPIRLAITSLFLAEQASKAPVLKTSLLTISELMVHPYRLKDVKLESDYRVFWQTNDFLEVGPIDLNILLNAAELRANYAGLKLPDAIHLATALAFGCDVFLTADEGIKGDYALDFRDAHPFYMGLTKGSGSIGIVHLSVDTVGRLIEQISA